MAKIFVSYVKENVEQVRRLVDALEAHGMEVWFDQTSLLPGHRWRDEVYKGISGGDYFIACFSDEYSTRSRSNMNEELSIAFEELRKRPFDRAWFIPVLLSDSEVPDIPIGRGETLCGIHWQSLHQDWDDGILKLLAVLDPETAQICRLISGLEDASARKRIRAADDLGKIGSLAAAAIPALTNTLEDKNETVRAAAADALGQIRCATADVVRSLLGTIHGGDVYAAVHAERSLEQLGVAAVPYLTAAVQDDELRSAALAGLSRLGVEV